MIAFHLWNALAHVRDPWGLDGHLRSIEDRRADRVGRRDSGVVDPPPAGYGPSAGIATRGASCGRNPVTVTVSDEAHDNVGDRADDHHGTWTNADRSSRDRPGPPVGRFPTA